MRHCALAGRRDAQPQRVEIKGVQLADPLLVGLREVGAVDAVAVSAVVFFMSVDDGAMMAEAVR